jgi:hypothetical protein
MNIKTFSISLTDSELKLLSTALVELPFKDVAPMINKINEQLQAQLASEPKSSEPKSSEPLPAQADLN